MCMQIFFPCSKPTPDMSFPLVHIKNFPHLNGQCRVDQFQPFHTILMYRTLTDPEHLRRLPHRRLCFHNISCNLNCTFLNIIFHCQAPEDAFLQCMPGDFEVCLYK